MIEIDILNSPSACSVAIVGLGRMGLRHVEACKSLDMVVCGLADISSDSLDKACVTHHIDRQTCFCNAIEMLDVVSPDALVIATTAPSHAEYTLAAAQKGVKYIICEKPMAVSLAEGDAMNGVCAQNGIKLAINHQMRFMAQYTQVKALIDCEELGPLASVLVAGSNFGLAMNASHYFEMFRFIADAPIRSVQAWFDDELLPNPRGVQFEDYSGRLMARSAAGPVMFIDFTAAAGHGLQVVYICRYGQVVVDELAGDMRVICRRPEYRGLPTTRYGMPADVQQLQIEPADTVGPTAALWRALMAGDSYPDGEAGMHALTCLVAAHVSHKKGGVEIALDDSDLPREQRFKWA